MSFASVGGAPSRRDQAAFDHVKVAAAHRPDTLISMNVDCGSARDRLGRTLGGKYHLREVIGAGGGTLLALPVDVRAAKLNYFGGVLVFHCT